MSKSNRLINEKSPYLLQHAQNPVDWFPWSDEAFETAAEQNKPIFLSIGYSTCHWCHVMEHESFEDEEVAQLMNQTFISIKVDREERPDIDSIYMSVCQMMTGGGGWPLTVIMTPDKKPFFAGTYFPKKSRQGRIGMFELINSINDAWINKKEQIDNSAEAITNYLVSSANKSSTSKFDDNLIEEAFQTFTQRFDQKHGGFGDSPKFPSPHNLIFLLRYGHLSSNNKSIEMVERTLVEMRKGGVFDHIGFGFHRYSTDKEWLLPHFEKMLYDQSMLILCYAEAYQKTKNEKYKKTAEEIITYVLRDMTSPEGGFYSAEDADSEGVEGKFYIWAEDELRDLLGDKFDLAKSYFNFVKEGNFIEESTRNLTGTNIIHINQSEEAICDKYKLSHSELEIEIESIRQKLFETRENRIHPLKDTKILTDWNGLMIAALSVAGRIFDNIEYIEAAQKSYEFILENLTTKEGKLIHRFKDGEAKIPGMLDDYAFLTWGCLELYDATFDVKFLSVANKFCEILIEDFLDHKNGGFYISAKNTTDILARSKESFDGAIPSGNSVSAMNFLRLGRIFGNSKYEEISESIVNTFSDSIAKYPAGFTHLLATRMFSFYGNKELVVVGDQNSKNFDEIKSFVTREYHPNKIVVNLNKFNRNDLCELAGYLINYPTEITSTQVYVCENYSCKAPLGDIEEIKKEIRN